MSRPKIRSRPLDLVARLRERNERARLYLTVACPTCHAPPGTKCAGSPSPGHVHPARGIASAPTEQEAARIDRDFLMALAARKDPG